ncbi:hypothetical protein DVT68_16240 [Dyella solisilvae]|uniref:Uncharacterized protein n=1 Tax=Dyella solisilvae TaxID=1920168 RepID=A0A370K3U4_9GAMM|nr:G1 family glutamic endopeptidase [Dyella solisilvae]RDI97314.1 hypothetical protein DVT68_16240 [Dyella solisilvae]
MATIKLSENLQVRTFPKPPKGFDPLKSDEKELARLGLPKRPSDPRLAARWENVMTRGTRFITPQFRAMPYKQRRLPQLERGKHDVESTDIWSGAVVHAPAGDSFQWVEGTWTVPNAYPPANAQDGVWYSASTWVGIDGIDGSGDVLQAGCDSDVMTSGGNISRQLNPWWEWYPAGSYWISNLPISPGDTVNCLICVSAGSTTEATIFLYNVTSNVAAHFLATAPAGTELVGNSAEWVVERLEIDTNTPELAQYGEVFFSEANAETKKKQLFTGGSGSTINMTDNGSVISEGIIVSSTVVEVKYTGPLS